LFSALDSSCLRCINNSFVDYSSTVLAKFELISKLTTYLLDGINLNLNSSIPFEFEIEIEIKLELIKLDRGRGRRKRFKNLWLCKGKAR